jgi:MFS family permease
MVNWSEVLIFIIIILLIVVIPVLIILITSAGENFWKVLGNAIAGGLISIMYLILSGGFLIFGVIFAYYNPKIGKTMTYIGIGGILLTLMILEVTVVGVTGKNRLKEEYVFEECKKLPVVKKDVASMMNSLSCIITGYFPQKYSSTYLIGFWIFGVAIPLIVLSGIFLDLVESSGIIKNYKRLIGWGLGFMAYRGFVVSNLIYIIDFVSAGVAVIVLNFIFVGGLLAYTNRIFSQWKTVEDAIELGKSQVIAAKNAKVILYETLKLAHTTELDAIKKNYLSQFESVFIQAGIWDDILKLLSENDKNNFIQKLKGIIDNLK